MITVCQFSPINSTFSPLRTSMTKFNLQEDPNTKSAKLHLHNFNTLHIFTQNREATRTRLNALIINYLSFMNTKEHITHICGKQDRNIMLK